MKLLPVKFLCVTLWHMSICAGVVVAVAFEQVNDTPYAKTSAQSNDKGLQDIDSFVKEIHK